MKAIVCRQYGPPASLKVEDIPIPSPTEHEVLIRVKATAINDWDWALLRGKPLLYRLMFGLTKPKKQVFGVELSGIVESVGTSVSKFKVGDRVYGDISLAGFGAWAEYVSVSESALVSMPDSMSFETATALPHASLLAYQGLITTGGLKDGQRLLINGAGGGVGSLGVQMAKTMDVHATGIDSQEKQAMMLELGYDTVLDYRETDYTKTGEQYNLILDNKTMKGPFSILHALKPGGMYASVGGKVGLILLIVLLKGIISLFSSKKLQIVSLKPNEGLGYIGELYEQGIIKPVIDGPAR